MAWLLNILMPGAGLVWHGRPVWGYALAVVYAPAAAAVIFGGLLTPAAVPGWLTVASAACAGGAFALAQIVLHRHVSLRRSPAWRSRLADLREQAERHFDAGQYLQAALAAEELVAADGEDLPAHVLRARSYAADGRLARARRAYEELGKADRQGRHADEVRQAMERFAQLRNRHE